MGASVSTNKDTINTNILQKAYNSCGSGARTQNVIDISNVTFDPPDNCNPQSQFIIGQQATADATCLIQNLQSSAAEVASTLSANAQAGLGFAVSTNVSDTTTNINNYVSNICAGASSTNQANIKDTVIKACKFVAVQNASAKESCQINNTQDVISQIASNASSNAQGASVWGLLFGEGGFGKILFIMLGLIIMASIILVLVKKFSGGNKGNNSGIELSDMGQFGGISNFFDSTNNPQLFTMFIIIIILLLVLFSINSFRNKKIIGNDIQKQYQNDPKQMQKQSNINSLYDYQLIDRPTDQPTYQSIYQPMYELIDQPTYQPNREFINYY